MKEKLIIKFIEGKLSGEEKISFERMIKEDATILNEINKIRDLDKILGDAFLVDPDTHLAFSIYENCIKQSENPILIDLEKSEPWFIQILESLLPLASLVICIYCIVIVSKNIRLDLDFFSTNYFIYFMTLLVSIFFLLVLDKILQKWHHTSKMFLA